MDSGTSQKARRLNVVTTSYGRASIALLRQTFLAQADERTRFVVLGDGWTIPGPEFDHPLIEFRGGRKSPPYGFAHFRKWWREVAGRGEYAMFVDDDNVLLPGILRATLAKMDGIHALWHPFVLHDGGIHPFWVGDISPRLHLTGLKVATPVEGDPPPMETTDSPLYVMAQRRWPGKILPCFGQLHYAPHASRETWEALGVQAEWHEEMKGMRPGPLKEYQSWP